ncbi:MAG: sigma-54 dependent transcriptional regulator [bacterium]
MSAEARNHAKGRILVVDDHREMVRLLADQLGDEGYEVDTATSGAEAMQVAAASLPDLVLTDLRMEGADGLDVLAAVHAMDPQVPVIIITAFGAVESAVDAMKRGAYDFLTKPFRLEEIVFCVERALGERRLREENKALRKIALDRSRLDAIVGRSAPIRRLFDVIERAAPAHAPVLVRGESGTGKELVARALHVLGSRREQPFVAVNCTALPEPLLESELFGHLKGSFTGATQHRRGLFVEADGGTLLLDEIGDMAPALQSKILRVLEDGEVRTVGSDVPRRVDVRVIASTNQPLEERIREGRFRPDLFYRLNVIPIHVPPLRDRRDDVPLLAEHFLTKARERNGWSRVKELAPALLSKLASLDWPGNVRQLENLVEQLVILCPNEVVDLDDAARLDSELFAKRSPVELAKIELRPLRQLEDEYIAWVIERCGGNKKRAAEVLGIDPSTIHRRERSSTTKP